MSLIIERRRLRSRNIEIAYIIDGAVPTFTLNRVLPVAIVLRFLTTQELRCSNSCSCRYELGYATSGLPFVRAVAIIGMCRGY